MSLEKRKVLFEKYKLWDYVDKYGNRIWLNKYWEIIRRESPDGNVIKGHYYFTATAEMVQDLRAMHGIDVEAGIEAALTEMLSQEIGRQIDLNIMRSIIDQSNAKV